MSSSEYHVHAVLSIKKETFSKNKQFNSPPFETTLPSVYYSVYFNHNDEKENTEIQIDEFENVSFKNMKLIISTADFQEDFSINNFYEGLLPTVSIKREDILNPEKKFFVNDVLTLEIHGIICYEIPKFGLEFLLRKNCDFTFIVGNTKIKAHKFIIRHFSSIFAAEIDKNIDEIKIENFHEFTVRVAIRLCYGDCWSSYRDEGHFFSLLKFTNTFDMPLVKEQTEHKFRNIITTKTVCEFANKSIELNAEILRGLCVNFLSNCIRNGKPFDGSFSNLHPEIKSLVFQNSFRQ
uniref:BTB domain-containing protein n=1 Tax=Panagrolaimus sp. ES5 TaxID=591445 RepID=A0AC34G4K5_9BILA